MDYLIITAELRKELPEGVDFAGWQLTQWEKPGAFLRRTQEGGTICYRTLPQLCRMLGFAAQGAEQVTEVEPRFRELSFMLDCSRNAVPTVATVKKLIRRLALMGYNALLLYLEDTYTLEGYPYFGYMRGRYTHGELREIDAYASIFGIEVIPCIQTLAHLNGIFHWKAFDSIHDTKDILLVDSQETDALIRTMISTCASLFRSRKIHIGMDEAEMLGKGKYEALHGPENRTSILLRHLNRVTAICREYGFTAKMWSDMFVKALRPLPEEEWPAHERQIREQVPEGTQLVYWDYYARQKEKYDRNIKLHRRLSDDVSFAGGAWKWSGFAPLLDHAMLASRLALESCLEHGVSDVMLTAWGDNGNECDLWTTLPIMQYYAEVCHTGAVDISQDVMTARMQVCTGIRYEDMMATSRLNYVPNNPAPGMISAGPAKYFLYQDPMLGLYDRHVDAAGCGAHYRACADEMNLAAQRNERETVVFETMKNLALVLERKCDFGIRLKQAYDASDRPGLEALAEECGEIIRRTERFRASLEKQWREKYKPFGWEVQDIRLGGLMCRMRTTASRIRSYLNGEVQHLEELEEERLPYEVCNAENGVYPIVESREWAHTVTAMDI